MSVPVAEYLRIPRRGGPVIGVCALIGLVAGVGVLLGQPSVFRATVPIFVSDIPVTVAAPGEGTPKWITVDTEARRVTENSVLSGISQATGDPDPTVNLDLGAVPGTKIMTIGYRSSSAELAAAGAATAASGYLTARKTFLLQRRSAVLAALAGNVDRLTTQLAQTPKNSTPDGKAARQQLYNRVGQLQTAMVNSTNLSVFPGNVLRGPAVMPYGDANRPVAPASGAVLGGLVGIGLARRRTDRIGSVTDSHDGSPVVPAAELAALAAPLRAHRPALLAVVPLAGEAESTAVQLAAELALPGERTAVVRIAEVPAVRQPAGDTIAGMTRLRLPAGLDDRLAIRALNEIRRDHVLTVVATPPIGTADAALLASAADTVVLLAVRGASTRDALRAAEAEIERLHVPVAGTVLAEPPHSRGTKGTR